MQERATGYARLFLDDGLGSAEGIGRGGRGGVGRVRAQTRQQVPDQRFQFDDALFQRDNPSIPLSTSWTGWCSHVTMLQKRYLRSCASFLDFGMNGYHFVFSVFLSSVFSVPLWFVSLY